MAKHTLTVGEAAEALGISKAHLYRRIRNNEFPAVRIGRRIVVPKLTVDRLLGRVVSDIETEE